MMAPKQVKADAPLPFSFFSLFFQQHAFAAVRTRTLRAISRLQTAAIKTKGKMRSLAAPSLAAIAIFYFAVSPVAVEGRSRRIKSTTYLPLGGTAARSLVAEIAESARVDDQPSSPGQKSGISPCRLSYSQQGDNMSCVTTCQSEMKRCNKRTGRCKCYGIGCRTFCQELSPSVESEEL